MESRFMVVANYEELHSHMVTPNCTITSAEERSCRTLRLLVELRKWLCNSARKDGVMKQGESVLEGQQGPIHCLQS